MKGVLYTGPYLDASGYGEATRNAIKALHVAGVDLKTQRVAFTGSNRYKCNNALLADDLSKKTIPYDIRILHITPDLYKDHLEPGKYTIGHLFWETNALPKTWVAACNKVNEIWTGSRTNARAIADSGVTVPIHIFPQAIETVLPEYKPFTLPNIKEDTLIFYSIFEWNERKDPRTLLDSYWKEFKGHDDVLLLIKTHKNYSKDGARDLVAEAGAWKNSLGFKDTPKVYMNLDVLSGEDIHRFHETGHIFVSTHRGEGWGLPQVEASLHTKPIISTGFNGVHDHLLMKHYHKIDHTMVEIDKVYNKYYEPGMQWAQADSTSLRGHMRKLYDYWNADRQRGLVKRKANEAKKLMSKSFNYETVGALMKGRLETIQESLNTK